VSPDSATAPITFATSPLPLSTTFDGGRLTSDGGLPWLGEADTALGLCEALAACIPEWRRGAVRHSLEALVRQRVFQIALGYEDQDAMPTRCAATRCSSCYAGDCRTLMPTLPASRRSRAWKTR
jgi:hypothetical protein